MLIAFYIMDRNLRLLLLQDCTLLVQAKLDALPDEAEVVISARVDKSGRIRPERTESEKKRDDIEALVRAEREDLGNKIMVF